MLLERSNYECGSRYIYNNVYLLATFLLFPLVVSDIIINFAVLLSVSDGRGNICLIKRLKKHETKTFI